MVVLSAQGIFKAGLHLVLILTLCTPAHDFACAVRHSRSSESLSQTFFTGITLYLPPPPCVLSSYASLSFNNNPPTSSLLLRYAVPWNFLPTPWSPCGPGLGHTLICHQHSQQRWVFLNNKSWSQDFISPVALICSVSLSRILWSKSRNYRSTDCSKQHKLLLGDGN